MATARAQRCSTLAWAALAAGLCAASLARADVYTWVDAKGNVNVSNLDPPDGARVLHVAHESAEAKARADAAHDAARQAEIKALSERVAELESKAQATFDAPPPIAFAPAPTPPPPPQYNVIVVPAAPAANVTPAADYGCAWVGCAVPWGPFGYPVVFFSASPRARHDRGFHHLPVHAPRMPAAMQTFGRTRRG